MACGNSQCPLAKKCSGYDGDNDCCVSYRGRTEVGGERAECYRIFKPQIRAGKEGVLERIFGRVAEGFMKAEGIEED